MPTVTHIYPKGELIKKSQWYEEEYVKYYEWNTLFGAGLIGIGWIIAFLGRKMTHGSHLQTRD